MKLKVICEKARHLYPMRRLIYTICFCLFCIIDQRTKTGTGLDGWNETFSELTGVVMAVLILSGCHKQELQKWKIPYSVWTVIGFSAGIGAVMWGKGNRPFLNEWLVIALNIVLYGYVLIHTVVGLLQERQRLKFNRKFLALWVGMMLWMIFSRSTYIWPLCYLVMFGCFYLTTYSSEEWEQLFQGMLDGIILGFLILQGLCFVFRPYDSVRYSGIYHNPNMNVLFYLEVLAAVLAKLVMVTKRGYARSIRVCYWLGSGVVLSFILLTIGRSGWIVATVLVILSLLFLGRIKKKKMLFKGLAVMCLGTMLTFPLCFCAVRYLPPVFHHPIWFWGEWNEQKVHSWDAWDSEKYVEFDEYVDAALGRVIDSIECLLEHSPLRLQVKAAEEGELVPGGEEPVPDNRIPRITPEQESDTLLVRGIIYSYYAEHLNMTGHPYEEQGFQMHAAYWIGHAHNIFLQYGTDFGIPVMVALMTLVLWGSVVLAKKFICLGDEHSAAALMFLLIPAVFGLLEYSWGVGSLSITMMFVAWQKVIRD